MDYTTFKKGLKSLIYDQNCLLQDDLIKQYYQKACTNSKYIKNLFNFP